MVTTSLPPWARWSLSQSAACKVEPPLQWLSVRSAKVETGFLLFLTCEVIVPEVHLFSGVSISRRSAGERLLNLILLMRGFYICHTFKSRFMTHYVCKGGCGGVLDEIGVCEADGCANQWEMMEECSCTDGKHGMEAQENTEKLVVKDSGGNILNDGDDVVLIKDLTLRGTSTTFKRGTKVSGIKLTDNPDEVDCKLGGTAIVLRTEFLKKV